MGILVRVFCLFGNFQTVVNGLGNVEVQLKSLTNSLGGHGRGTYMEIFLEYLTNRGVNISRIVTTEVFQKSNDIRFNTSSGLFNNPFKLPFVEFKNSLYLVFRVLDASTGSTTATSQQDMVRQVVGQGEPHAFFSNSPFIDKELNGTNINVKFSYRLQCEVYYYGESCGKLCRPKPGQYNCSQYGNKVCEPGWIAPACDKMEPTNPCYNNTCQHNSTCLPQSKPKDGITCACGPRFTGEHCEYQISTTSASTTVLISKQRKNQTYVIKTNATEMEKRSFLDDVTKEDIFIAGCTVAGLLLLLVVLLTSIFCCFYKKRKIGDVIKVKERRDRS